MNPVEESMEEERIEIQGELDATWGELDSTGITDEQKMLINKLVDSNIEIEKLCNA